MEQIIGRKKEIELLTEYYHSGKAEFVAVYGRRRIGKTYLVRNLFRDKFAFDMSGSIEAPAEAQLSNFRFALREYGDSKQPIPTNWTEAFERVCMLHIPQIKHFLGIDQIHTEYYSWRSKVSKPAAQIDLLIERADNLVNLCEIKYSQMPYTITKEEDMRIRNRMADFVAETGIKSGIITTMITTFGVRLTQYAALAQVQITMDDLFG